MCFRYYFNYIKLLFILLPLIRGEINPLPNEINKKANILFVVVDDLRHLAENIVNLPNFEKLAGNSIHFRNAFAQQALCAPSRNSMLTGRRPDSLRLYDFYSYWRDTDKVANYTTIPQFFKENGYQTYSVGKIFHPGVSSNFTDDFPYSWSHKPFHPKTDKFKDSKVCIDKKSKKLRRNLICPVNVETQPGHTLPDLETLDFALNILKEHRNEKDPYFLAVGFHKPHVPLKYPKEYLEKFPISNVTLPKIPYIPKGMPIIAWHPWNDLRKRDDIHSLNISYPFGTMPRKWTRKIRQSYLAASIYVDDLLGILMSAVDMSKTIVVFVSDHGWSLGENGLWAKYSNFDVALKVPLIISTPWLQPKIIDEPIELIDLFPTLLDLTNNTNAIPKCNNANKDSNLKLCLEGKSLVNLMETNAIDNFAVNIISENNISKNNIFENNISENNISENYVAISQYPRPSVYPSKNSDKPRLKDIIIMGYTIRTIRYRYTEWIEFNHTTFTRNWDYNYGSELYDHNTDPMESNNVFLLDDNKILVQNLSKLLRSKINT